MVSVNKVMLGGYLTADPESVAAGQGTVCKFSIGISRNWTSGQGQKKEETTFVDCEAWGKVAEVAQNYLKKGRPVLVEGRLKLDRWEAPDGQKRSKLKVSVENIQFLDSAQGQGGADGEAQAQPAAPAYDPEQPF